MTQVPDIRTTPCRGCGKRVMFVTTADGAKVPLDVVAPVFHRIWDPDSQAAFWVSDSQGGGERTAFVSHFATCSHANEFSGSRRRETRK